MNRIVKQILSKTVFYRLYQMHRTWDWRRKGMKGPPPHLVKVQTVMRYARNKGIRLFVETGTYWGDMIQAVRGLYDEMWSIEVAHDLCVKAVKRFRSDPRIHIVEGDSAVVLPCVLRSISAPCVFWLDGHYSGGNTGRGVEDSPIKEELKHILGHHIRDHVILVDDARCFLGRDGYPTIEELTKQVQACRPEWIVSVVEDIIRIHGENITEHVHLET